MSFGRGRAVADAVLFEGYALYPYRASAPKNRFRWALGVLAPRAWSEASGCEPSWLETQCLIESAGAVRIDGRLRFLQVERRTVERAEGDGFRAVESLEVGGRLHLTWDEAEVREIELACTAGAGEAAVPFAVPGGSAVEVLRDAAGVVVGRVVRTRHALRGTLRISAEPVAAPRPLHRLRIRAENDTAWPEPEAPREAILPASCVAAHLLLQAVGGAFLSLLDPPAWAAEAARACRPVRAFPVLAGPPGHHDLVLAAPLILYDHPQVAPESPGDFYDATEIDELLTLRTATLTDGEKREARATDARTAALLDRVEGLPPERMDRLHGAVRDLHRAEMVPRRRPPSEPRAVAAAGIEPGSRVRLRPGRFRTDAQDLLYAGQAATVEAVLWDVDGRPHLAVTIDEDPAADLHRWHGRYHYYRPEEVERIEPPRPAPRAEGGP